MYERNVVAAIKEAVEHFHTGPVKLINFNITTRDDVIHVQISLEKIHDASTTD